MAKLAAIGDRYSVQGFAALGLEVFPTDDPGEARRILARLSGEDCAAVLLTEPLAAQLPALPRSPAVVLIPGPGGPSGLAQARLREASRRALGVATLPGETQTKDECI